MPIRNYQELIAWQRAMDLVESVYRTSSTFPKEEVYGLTSQVRRASISVPSNIAEGQGRSTTRDFLHFLCVAQGSLKELETQILIAQRLGYLAHPDALLDQVLAVARLLSGLINSLKRKPH